MAESLPGAGRASGLIASLRALGATVVELLYTRLELIATELDEERVLLFRVFAFAGVAIFFLSLAILTLTFIIILLAWDTHRLLASILLVGAYLGIGSVAALKAHNAARSTTRRFSATLAQLRKDRDELTPR